MKSNVKKVAALLLGTSMFFMLSLKAEAQEKPKGKEWKAPEAAAKAKNPVKADDASAIKAGKDIYSQHCKSCHGAKGKGDGSKAAKIDISCGDFTGAEYKGLSDGVNYWKTTEGRKPMPGFKQKLSDTERWQVIAYIRTLE